MENPPRGIRTTVTSHIVKKSNEKNVGVSITPSAIYRHVIPQAKTLPNPTIDNRGGPSSSQDPAVCKRPPGKSIFRAGGVNKLGPASAPSSDGRPKLALRPFFSAPHFHAHTHVPRTPESAEGARPRRQCINFQFSSIRSGTAGGRRRGGEGMARSRGEGKCRSCRSEGA